MAGRRVHGNASTYREQRGHAHMLRTGFKPANLVFKQYKAVRALHSAETV